MRTRTLSAAKGIAANIINAGQDDDMRLRMRRHAGRVVALKAGTVRLCFRIDEGGRWQQSMSLLRADAEIQISGGKIQISGEESLLRDLHEMRGEKFAENIVGPAAVQTAQAAAERLDIKNMPVKCGAAADPAEVEEFNRKTAALAQKSQELETRTARLERAQKRRGAA